MNCFLLNLRSCNFYSIFITTLVAAARISFTDLTTRNVSIQVTGLDNHLRRISKLQFFFDSRQPEAESVVVKVTCTSAHTFHEWRSSEGFETRTWRGQVGSTTGLTFSSVLQEGVTIPHVGPVVGTFWLSSILRVDSHDVSFSFANGTSGDIVLQISTSDSSHIHRRTGIGSQPVRLITSRGKFTLFVQTAIQVRHGRKGSETRTSRSQILEVRVIVTVHVHE